MARAIPIVPAGQPAKFFENYTKLEPRVPMPVWYAARAAVLIFTLGMAILLIAAPARGLELFWRLAIPIVPAILVVVPGLWRQVCPMATMNQIPRLLGKSRNLELPPLLKTTAFGIAVAIFLVAVGLRVPLLNGSGPLVGFGILAVLLLALLGGWVYKGRSGWCGTFCPLAPIQRTYGQAPLLLVRNGYCNPCVGCQKSCYDFNPRAAVFSDVYDDDPRYASQRRLFMGLLPGLILAYFMQGPAPVYGEPQHALILAIGVAASAGFYGLAVAFLPINPYRIALAFGALALTIFYWYAGPIVVATLSGWGGAEPPAALVAASRGLGFVAAALLAGSGLYAETRYAASRREAAEAKAAARAAQGGGKTMMGGSRSLKDRVARSGAAEVTDRESGITFQVGPDATLLEAIETAGLKISFGCRAGVCGADPVVVCEGGDNLSAASDDELATLRRLGLEGRARLACMCNVKGPVLIDRDPRSSPTPAASSAILVPPIDKAARAGIAKVVIVGNGIAGMSAAEALRRGSASLKIDIVTNEPHHFYNRMGIGRLVYDSGGMDALRLVPEDWPRAQRITVWRNTVATRLDRGAKTVILSSGESLAYDRLILATGARSTLPDPEFMSNENAFVLRSADDAQAIRDHAKKNRCRRAVVIGGGVLGVEAADSLHKLGMQVLLLQRADRVMNAQLDEVGAARLSAYLDSIGIQVVPNVTVTRYDCERGRIQAAWLSHGPRVRGDLFVACLGIQPNSFLAEQSGIEATKAGIRVDSQMRSSDPDVYAIGDVADLPGTPRGLWPIGGAHATTAVDAIFGEKAAYQVPRLVLQLKCEGVDLRSYGVMTPAAGDEVYTARPDDDAWWRFIVRDNRLAGCVFVGPPGSAKSLGKLLQQPMDLAPLRDHLRAGNLEGLRRAATA